MAIRIAVDAMGGDQAPSVVLEGALQALQRAPGDLELMLFGPEDVLRDELAALEGASQEGLQIVDAPQVIGMAESPVAAVKSKQQSSIHLGLGAHKKRHADAFISAGNTGAVMAASLFILGRLPGVARPSIPAFFPTTEGASLVLDVGTNVDCKPEHLVQFAQMGNQYVKSILKIDTPRVALLNVGEEPGKGNEVAKAAYSLFEQVSDIQFIGNVEGRDIMHHEADVVVCDGFVGNVLLKFGESTSTAVMHMVRQEIERQSLAPEQIHCIQQVLGAVRKRFNPEEYGGVPLLGVDGTVIIGHGSSTARAFAQMIQIAVEAIEQNLTAAIAEALEQ